MALDPEEILWPDGTVSKAPANDKGPRGGRKKKVNPNSKHGVFGKIVNEYGLKTRQVYNPKVQLLWHVIRWNLVRNLMRKKMTPLRKVFDYSCHNPHQVRHRFS